MKRLYSIMLSAAVAVAASAAIPSAKANVSGELSDLKAKGHLIAETVLSRSAAEKAQTSQPRRAASRAVAAPTTPQDLVDMQWEASYQGLLNGNAGLHSGEAVFTLDGSGRPMLKLPDYANSLLVGLSDNGELQIYGTVNYGQNSQGYDMKLMPITTSGQPSPASVTVPFNPETGAFEFPSTFAWGMLAYSGDSFVGYFWAGYKFSINLVEGDYSIQPSFTAGEISANNKWTLNVETGADVASTRYIVMNSDEDASKYTQYYTSLGTELEGSTLNVDPVNDNYFNQQMTETGYASVIFGALDADNNVRKTNQIALPVIIDDEQEGWATVGTTTFVDGLFTQYYNYPYTKEGVVVQAKTDNSPVYRFVMPYADDENFNLGGHTHSMVIDATHSDWVGIPCTFSGLDLSGDGTLAFGSFMALGYDYETAKARGLAGGTIEENVVTFPTRTLLAHEQFYNEPGSWTYATTKEDVTFTLPAITLNVKVDDEEGQPAEGVEIKIGEEVVGTTDAEGNAVVAIPFSVGYFGEVELTIVGETVTVTLNGNNNEFNFVKKLWKMSAVVGEVGESIKVRPEAIPDVNNEITWSSSNPEVAAVDEDGKVWFNAAGSAVVTAQCQGFELTVPFEVEAVLARALNVFPVEAVGGKGHSFCLLALHEPDNTTDKSVVWHSEDPEVASVDETGRVELLSSGTTKIVATSGEHTAACSVTVDNTDSLTELASTGVVIDVVEDGIVVRNVEEGESIAVYTIDGKVINGAVAQAGETKLTLTAGIYIVKVSPDTVAKVLVK